MSIRRTQNLVTAPLALVMAAVLAVSACSGSDDAGSDSVASAPVGSNSVETNPVETNPGESIPSDTVSTESLPTDAEGAALLESALVELGDRTGYHFLTVVSAGGGVALQAEGDLVGDGSRFVVLRDDVIVEYVVTPDGTWVMPEGEEWRASDIPSTTANPVPALASATAITVESADATTVTLVASVPDAVLGYDGDGATDVRVVLLEGSIDQVQYDTTVQGLAASLLTRVGPVTDDAPVVAPI